MAKIKNDLTTNIKVIVNAKGGVGKGVTAKVLATIGNEKYKEINVYEIDNNNSKGNLVSNLINHKVFKIDEKNEAIFDVSFNADDKEILSIIDSGGGDDSKKVIESLAKNKISDVEFFIPTLDDDETISNIISTISTIKSFYPTNKITLILNKTIDATNYKNQFINIFGSEKYGYKSRFDEIANDLDSIAIIPFTPLIFIIKNLHRIEMSDLYQSSTDLIDNINDYRIKWKNEAKEKNDKSHYFKKMELVDFGVDLVEFINECKKTLKV